MAELDALILRRNAFKSFASDAKSNLGHAYLLVCEDGLARERLLTLMAKSVFCPRICGECATCKGIEDRSYLDVVFFDGAEMKVPDITDLTETAMIKPVLGDRKIYLIDNADKLSPQAQNKLLKTYEEPPAYLTVILACSSKNGILTTIKSRAKKLYFDSFTAREIIDYLTENGADAREADVAAAVSNGSLERAEKFLHSETFASLYDGCFTIMNELTASGKIPELVFREEFNKENVKISFDIMEIILCDVMKIKSGSGLPLLNDGREYDIKKIAEKYTAQSAAMSLAAINEGRKLLNSNVSSVSAAESVLFKILEAKYKWQ